MTGESRGQWSRWGRRIWTFIRSQSNYLLWIMCVVLFVVIYFWHSLFVTIQSGESGVMYRRFDGGTVTDKLLSEGLRFVPPWDRLYVYNVRLQEYHHSMWALTKEGVEVKLEISVRWRPELELVALLHQKIGPNYKDTVIKPEIEATLRRIVGSHNVGELYADASTVGRRVLERSLEQAQQNYVHIDEVLVRSVELPKELRDRITAKLMAKEEFLTYAHRINVATEEKKRLLIEAEGIKAYNDKVAESLTATVLQWQAVQATKELAKSENAKTVVIGRNSDGLPIILPK